MKRIIIAIVLVALILFGASLGLQGVAAKKAQEEHLWLMQTLLPGSKNFTVEPYDGEDANIQSVHKADNGFVIETLTYGYADNIRMLIGVSNEGKVTDLVVREAHETVGLGNNALTDHEFLSQFLNGSGSFEVATHGADAFSSATGTADAGTGEFYVRFFPCPDPVEFFRFVPVIVEILPFTVRKPAFCETFPAFGRIVFPVFLHIAADFAVTDLTADSPIRALTHRLYIDEYHSADKRIFCHFATVKSKRGYFT